MQSLHSPFTLLRNPCAKVFLDRFGAAPGLPGEIAKGFFDSPLEVGKAPILDFVQPDKPGKAFGGMPLGLHVEVVGQLGQRGFQVALVDREVGPAGFASAATGCSCGDLAEQA